MDAFTADCGHTIPALPEGHVGGTGYGYRDTSLGRVTMCYACCAAETRADMIESGAAVLYLAHDGGNGWRVTDWPGVLSFRPSSVWRTYGRTPRGARYPIQSARFTGPDGAEWSIVVRGDMQCGRARRLKRQPRRVA